MKNIINEKLELKDRLRNPQFYFQILIAVIVPILSFFGISAEEVNSWNVLYSLLLQALSNPYVIFLIFVSVYNAVVPNRKYKETTTEKEESVKGTTLDEILKRKK